jgi:hypothetical protein
MANYHVKYHQKFFFSEIIFLILHKLLKYFKGSHLYFLKNLDIFFKTLKLCNYYSFGRFKNSVISDNISKVGSFAIKNIQIN